MLCIMFNGEVVAEATLVIHDPKVAWQCFLDAFPNMGHLVAGELLNTMRIACNDDLWERDGSQGILIDLRVE